jgi:hypothetical protein
MGPWYVKAQNKGQPEHSDLCDTPEKVREIYQDLKRRYQEVWITDHQGRKVDPKSFGTV